MQLTDGWGPQLKPYIEWNIKQFLSVHLPTIWPEVKLEMEKAKSLREIASGCHSSGGQFLATG